MSQTQRSEKKVLDVWTSEDVLRDCSVCKAHAIVELTPRLKALQPDDTVLVCHPGFRGCNTGFAVDALNLLRS